MIFCFEHFPFLNASNGILFDCFRTCKFGKSDPQLKFIVFRPLRLLIMLGKLPQVERKEDMKKNERYWQHSQSEVAKKGEVKTVSTCQLKSSTMRCYCCGCLDVSMPEICRSVWLLTSMNLQGDANKMPDY